jgi:pimeloyl-ACP methyl ester carboxylesterase
VKTYLLVHGAWHGAWCWHKVVARLERLGHKVLAPDLPGFGRDRTPMHHLSLRVWREFLCDLIDAQSEPVILVGHSRGGILISEVAEQRPERIRTLVYLTGFLLRDGETLFHLAQQSEGSELVPNLVASDDGTSLTVREEAIRSAFYGECWDDDVALARLLLQPEPALPSTTPVHVTAENFGRVPRAYIACSRDRAITPPLQRQMYRATPCSPVLWIDADHSPFFSRPDELVAHLVAL